MPNPPITEEQQLTEVVAAMYDAAITAATPYVGEPLMTFQHLAPVTQQAVVSSMAAVAGALVGLAVKEARS